VVVADTGNHRVLIWHSWPTAHGQAADVVLGHGTTPGTMFSRNGRNDGESYPTDAVFSEPTGVYYSAYYTVLLVADSDNHRVLVFDAELSAIASGRAADHVIGQSGMYAGDANRGGDVDRFCFDTPTDVALVRDAVSGDSRIFVADSGNNRVLVFEDYLFDSNGPPAQHVIGQTSMTLTTAPEPPNAATLEQPWAVWSDGTIVAVSDMGNHRVLVYDAIPTADGVSASSVLGQATMAGCSPSCGGSSLENPRGIVFDSLGIWVADTSNNRVVLFP
jgi:DNA-binding beta-propeller fold protein YncE